MDIRTSATIVQGKTNNRVAKRRKPMTNEARAKLRAMVTSGRLKLICASFPPDVLARVDAARKKMGLSRSKFLQLAGIELAIRWGL